MSTSVSAHVVVRHADLDINLDIAGGEVVAIMGPSGAGKTTLLEAIAGLVRLDDGTISFDGTPIASAAMHTPPSGRGVGLLGQDALLFPHMTASENIEFAARASGQSRDEARNAASDWLARMGLPDFGARRVRQLSGGQAQRIALARALAARPRLLLLDEPFSSLDVEAAASLRQTVHEHITGTTTMVVSHTAADAQALADRLIILERGKITQQGTVDEVLGAPATSFAAAVAASV